MPTNSITHKLVTIGILVLGLMIPLRLIKALVQERESRSRSVASEIGELWGDRQTVIGPILEIPLRRAVEPLADTPDLGEWLRILPEELHIETEVDVGKRRRGIFETVVYTARLKLQGRFKLPFEARDPGAWPRFLRRSGATLALDQSVLFLELSDLRDISESPGLLWQGERPELEPAPDFPGTGIEARLPALASEVLEFEITLSLNGGGHLEFVPLGRETSVVMRSDWSNPSFQGASLPTDPQITAQGFEASWGIPVFARSAPESWIDGGGREGIYEEMRASAFGVSFLLPVDRYQKTERCIKYALLFIVLTFATFLLFELISDLRVHPVQYLMVGFALCLFYQLLLAISEHVGFNLAYVVAAIATVLLISGYSSAVLKTRQRVTTLAIALTVLYSVLLVLVQLQTYTLLVGSFALFLALGLFMYLTRNFDWYELGRKAESSQI